MSNLLTSLFVEFAHDLARPDFRVLHHDLLNEDDNFWLQEAPIIDFQLVVMYKFELVHPFVQADLVIPLEAHIDRALRISGQSRLNRVVRSLEKPRLVALEAAEGEEDQLVEMVLFLVHREHHLVWVAELAVRVDGVEHAGKRFWEVAEVVREAAVN